MRKTLFTVLFLMLAGQLEAATGWIGDTVYVPVRSGPGNQYRILHRGLRTGTEVEILQMEEGSEWTHIRYGDIEGYVNTQYVTQTPTAGQRLARAEQQAAQAREQAQGLRQQLATVTGERDRLVAENRQLTERVRELGGRLDNLQEVAADPIRLDQANRKLNEQVSQLRTQLDTLQAENAMLRSDTTTSKWITGAAILVLGALFGWIFKSRSGRARSSWA